MIDYRLYLVTDDPSRYRGDWRENVEAAIAGGVTCVQYRDTETPLRAQYARVRSLQDVLRLTRTPLVVNNDAELAAAVGAEGVHVGQGDLPPARVREIVGSRCEIGLSLTCAADWKSETEALVASGVVSCLGIGPVFDAVKTKADAAPAMGLEGLSALSARAPFTPNVAIGGIGRANAADVLKAGAKGLALVSAFSKADDPCAEARFFRGLFA